jgi:mannose-6-phosphate isomerase-like protein (cupin superfamily)
MARRYRFLSVEGTTQRRHTTVTDERRTDSLQVLRDASGGDEPAVAQVIARGPGEGYVIPGPEGITLKVTGAETGGSIGVFEGTTPAGFGPPRHIHYACDELFYVLSGEFEFLVGERVFRAGPGTFVFIPRGTVHAPKVVSSEPGRVLAAFVPGGQEIAFEELAQLAAEQGSDAELDPDRTQAIAMKYNSTFVGPPL